MTLEQLRIFVAVAERQHVTAAAAALGLTQSAASAAIAALEAQYDTKLFHRLGRGIALTGEGALFLQEARGVLARAGEAETVLSDLGGLKRGVLKLYASQTVGTYWLPQRLLAFRLAYPGISLDYRIGNTEQVAAAVLDGSVQLGFVEGTVHDPHLKSRIVARDRLLLVVGPSHPWAGRRKPVKAAQFQETAWVLRERGSGTRAIFDDALAAHKLDPAALNVLLELPSNEAVATTVSGGAAASILSTSVVLSGLEAGLLHAVPFELPERCYCLLTHKSRHLGRSAGAFLAGIAKR
jgi:DNA-binding transcriptional LysR family regulator